ncbi:hypothetical protein EVG20_g8288 [Dentipellis fragilis]|uniref:F-box domain-containing protein n=1 Tax=Dentipellis fragilis TaxID=205917 RepID=A0A4Y9Y939_9AGAM|nr:hypothetical protein EVG20_g8288 [Dentipellis fragilis]
MRELTLMTYARVDGYRIDILDSVKRQLRVLSLSYCAIPWTSNLYNGLVQLSITFAFIHGGDGAPVHTEVSPSFTQLLGALQTAAPTLRTLWLEIHADDSSTGHVDNWTHPSITLPCLTSLTLQGDSCVLVPILQHLRLPVEAHLNLECGCRGATYDSNLRDVLPILKRISDGATPSPGITHIHMEVGRWETGVVAYASPPDASSRSLRQLPLFRVCLMHRADADFPIWWRDNFFSHLQISTLTSLEISSPMTDVDYSGSDLPMLKHLRNLQVLSLEGEQAMSGLLQYLHPGDVLPSLETLDLRDPWTEDWVEVRPKEWDDLRTSVRSFLTDGKLWPRLQSIVLRSHHPNLSTSLRTLLQTNFPNVTVQRPPSRF